MSGHGPAGPYPWERQGDTIYSLMERNGAPTNWMTIGVNPGPPWTATTEERFRIAKLIHAAPQMLEALKALHRDARPVNWDESGINDNETAAWRLLDAALAAAERTDT